MCAKVKREIKSRDFISLCTDSWSSKENSHSVLAVTAHFLDENFEPKFLVLAAAPIKGRHTGDNLSSIIVKVIFLSK